MNNYRLSTFK
jgi:hypothetical protein